VQLPTLKALLLILAELSHLATLARVCCTCRLGSLTPAAAPSFLLLRLLMAAGAFT
jgi:hypothetical protein